MSEPSAPSRSLALLLVVAFLSHVPGCGTDSEGPAVASADSAADSAEGPSTDSTSDPSETDSAGALYSPEAFLLAAHDGKLRVVEICLESGMDVNHPNENGFTPLAMAAYNGHDKVVQLLIKQGATVDSRDRVGSTPLIHAASGPFPTTVQMLLDHGADVNAVDDGEHFTPLMMAAAEGHMDVVKVLLQAGAKPDARDLDGESAADFARAKGHLEIAELLSAK